ncbi:hypothetical protein [Vibrio brasiliensis]|nr:hypothetical protein [Vibrio brasiliensis]
MNENMRLMRLIVPLMYTIRFLIEIIGHTPSTRITFFIFSAF